MNENVALFLAEANSHTKSSFVDNFFTKLEEGNYNWSFRALRHFSEKSVINLILPEEEKGSSLEQFTVCNNQLSVKLNTEQAQSKGNYIICELGLIFNTQLVDTLIDQKSKVCIVLNEELKKNIEYNSRNNNSFSLHDINSANLKSNFQDFLKQNFSGIAFFSFEIIQFLEDLIEEKYPNKKLFKDISLYKCLELIYENSINIKVIWDVDNCKKFPVEIDIKSFVLKSKANTLKNLSKMLIHSNIINQLSFSVSDWNADRFQILNDIKAKFFNSKIAIRSSAASEDSLSVSNAGAFKSFLKIDSSNKYQVEQTIDEVIASYGKYNPFDAVLVQKFISNSSISGVIMSRTLGANAPYVVFEYDEISGKTDTVTKGTSQDIKTLYVLREKLENNENVPEKLQPVLKSLIELEALIKYNNLDIEFTVDDKNIVTILQVRPIVLGKDKISREDNDFFELIKDGRKLFLDLQSLESEKNKKKIFGMMPDWNPAEVIGAKPNKLAYSLYELLITDDVWARQRSEFGYQDLRPQKLMRSFCGHPYIDVRASLSSFIPKALPNHIANKLIDFSITRLEENPELHDKIEFEIIPTCIDLNFEKWSLIFIESGNFTPEEISIIEEKLTDITINAIENDFGEKQALEKLNRLYSEIELSTTHPLEKAEKFLEVTKSIGTPIFAHFARKAFISISILKSALEINLIDKDEYDGFFSSINTIGKIFLEDMAKFSKKECEIQFMFDKYGHLRPGTYDITSASYRENPEYYFKSTEENIEYSQYRDLKKSKERWEDAFSKIMQSLKKRGVPFESDLVSKFLHQSIEGREYSKFVFTKGLSMALDELIKWGEEENLTRSEISHLSWDEIKAYAQDSTIETPAKKYFSKKIKKELEKHEIVSGIEMPPLICNDNDFLTFYSPDAVPNFIGREVITSEFIYLSSDVEDNIFTKGKIFLIPCADPGYDWIFNYEPVGLITMYGGANSHMAIRAAEFGISASIGVGKKMFNRLTRSSKLQIDPINKILRIVN